jgi:selenocysteine lyase/cysteine desulfurase
LSAIDWNGWRQYFPVTRRWAFFDHAAVAPISGPACDALMEWAADVVENGAVHERRWLKRIEEVRSLVGQLVNADPLDIAFIKNTSEGIGIVAEGLPWRSGDNVVTAAEEYPANIYPWLNLASRGVETRLVPSKAGRIPLDDIRAAMDGRTRLLTLSHVEFSSGYRHDLAALGELCRERGVYFFVDAIQGLGVLPLDVRALPIDFLAADGHKWLLGPEGAGIFYIRRELVDRLHAVDIGWNSVVGARNFSKIDFRLKPHAGRWESGSLNVGGISALGASLQLLLRLGLPAISARVLELTDAVCEGVQRLGLEVYSSRTDAEKSGIVSVAIPGTDPGKLVRSCREANIVINQRAGRLRVSPHFYNSADEIEHLLQTLRALLKKE